MQFTRRCRLLGVAAVLVCLGPADAPLSARVRTAPATVASRQAPDLPLRVGGDIPEPRKVRHVDPVYPAEARAIGIAGIVILEVTIGPDGKVANARVLRSVPLLDDAALTAVREWEYQPTIFRGQPVSVLMTVMVNFAPGGRGGLQNAGRGGAGGPMPACVDGEPPALDLTGRWRGDDGATYQFRAVCLELFWVLTNDEQPPLRVFHGTAQAPGQYSGRWADLAPVTSGGTGTLTLHARSRTELEVMGDPANFTVRRWTRIE